MTGEASSSSTRTMKVHSAWRHSLLARHRIGWLPAGRQVPAGGIQSISAPFDTVGSEYCIGTQLEKQGIRTTRLLGHNIAGGALGAIETCTLNTHSAWVNSLAA